VLALATSASAQTPYPPPNWAGAPTGSAWQAAYPYPGQCVTAANAPLSTLPVCTLASAPSFACDSGGTSNQTAASWGKCGSVTAPPLNQAVITGDTQRYNKYVWEALNPLDYAPDTGKYKNADYYEIGLHEAWGFDGIAKAGLFPNPGTTVPNGKQWTGLVDPATQAPLLTPIWGIGQVNMNGGPVTSTLASLGLFKGGPASSWSGNGYVATWPSISIRGTTGRPVVVKYINEFPNNHLYCPHPEAADWPCAIDRTFMGVKFAIDPQKAPATFQNNPLPYNGVNQFGSPMQPDNSWVTHLHGGEIPPQTDGFAEKWFGNRNTGKIYSPQPWPLDPAFNAPKGALSETKVGTEYSNIFRPGGSPTSNAMSSWYYDTYTYPMVNDESTIWFHDHTLGKTHHNVVAGPAGFFPVKDPSKHHAVKGGICTGPKSDSCEYTWVDVVTEARGDLGIPDYDLFFAIQDRDFNADGSINFPNGMSQVTAPPCNPDSTGACQNPAGASGYWAAPGNLPFAPGPNPQVHPVWVPEYFASNALVNGVLWPKKTVINGNYRIRLVDGSDARCYNLSFSATNPWITGAGGVQTLGPKPTDVIPFTIIANEQGYLPAAVTATSLTMCPGERYEFVFDFSAYAGKSIYMINDAAAPFPDGGTGPFDPGSPYQDLATIMRFDVVSSLKTPISGTPIPPVATCPRKPLNLPASCLWIPPVLDQNFVALTDGQGHVASGVPVAAVRNLYLNERIDGTTGASLGLQINGVPFEYDVTETPRKGTYEVWNIINTTVDAHPIHPHLVKAQIVRRQTFDVGAWRLAMCQADPADNACTFGPTPGGVMQLTVDPSSFLTGSPAPPPLAESGWKDAIRAYPGQVLTFIAKWDGSWRQSTDPKGLDVTAPGSGNPNCYATNVCTVSSTGATSSISCAGGSAALNKCGGGDAAFWVFPAVTSGPYVWHCHINSHEDSEMMRSSLVVK
jgi:FtsP/CotA-like multicopper oxidase with cupredoxin domain